MKNTYRLDDLLVLKNIIKSKTKAKALIMAGKVEVEGKIVDKPGLSFSREHKIILKKPLHEWVSRGGLKLEHGLKFFNISAKNLIALDIGSSTGGFSHVLLHSGIKKVYSVDVGYGQIDLKIRNDSRIKLLERTNARYLDSKNIPEKIDLIVCDVSFISLKKVLMAPLKLTSQKAELIALIKPQFEVGRLEVDKGGIVKNKEIRKKCCLDIRNWLQDIMNWKVTDITESPIKGAKGNIEYLIHAKK